VLTRAPPRRCAGSYTVRWRATGTDGDLVEEEFPVRRGYALTAAAPDAQGPPIAWLSAAAALAAVRGLCDRVRRPDRRAIHRHRAG